MIYLDDKLLLYSLPERLAFIYLEGRLGINWKGRYDLYDLPGRQEMIQTEEAGYDEPER
jgi:hypothetical protein